MYWYMLCIQIGFVLNTERRLMVNGSLLKSNLLFSQQYKKNIFCMMSNNVKINIYCLSFGERGYKIRFRSVEQFGENGKV